MSDIPKAIRSGAKPKIVEYFSQNPEIQSITGFVGSSKSSLTTTLGRGGSDYTAAIVGAALNASVIEIWTDVDGVLDADKKLIPELTMRDAKALIADGTISGGMIPKVETCLDALDNGVEGVVILNGKTPHVVLVELFTEHGAGTLIVR